MGFWSNHKTKILGSLGLIVTGVLSLVALGMFDATADDSALLSNKVVRWLTVCCLLIKVGLEGGTVAAGFSNTTKERVAASEATTEEAKATVAAAMESAIKATPGETQ